MEGDVFEFDASGFVEAPECGGEDDEGDEGEGGAGGEVPMGGGGVAGGGEAEDEVPGFHEEGERAEPGEHDHVGGVDGGDGAGGVEVAGVFEAACDEGQGEHDGAGAHGAPGQFFDSGIGEPECVNEVKVQDDAEADVAQPDGVHGFSVTDLGRGGKEGEG